MNINKQNKIIEEIILEIDNLLKENKKKPINEIFGIVSIASKYFGPKLINSYLRTGGQNLLKKKLQNKISSLKSDAAQEIKDLFKSGSNSSYDIQSDVDEIEKIRDRIRSKLSSYSYDEYDTNTYDSSDETFNNITVKFKDDFKLVVKADRGKEYEKTYRTYNTEKFDVVTTKKTSQGYILNLKNYNLPKNVSLLMFIDNYRTSGNIRVQLQLTYENGVYTGNRISNDVEIISLK